MLGRGKSSGVINEATNQHTNEKLTAAVDEMKTKEYQKQRERDTTDVIPTHRHLVKKAAVKSGDEHLEVFTNDKTGDSGSDDDFDLEAIRAARANAIKKEQSKMSEWRQKQHGSYREIGEGDFFTTVVKEKGGSEHVVVHFYHDDFERCKIMDRHLLDLAHRIMPVRFVKVNAATSPFLIEKLKITMLPCLFLFANDIAVDRVLGFEDFGDEDLDPEMLRHRIETGLGLSE
jgi:thiol-disulfide isomerase/thioredoxin